MEERETKDFVFVIREYRAVSVVVRAYDAYEAEEALRDRYAEGEFVDWIDDPNSMYDWEIEPADDDGLASCQSRPDLDLTLGD